MPALNALLLCALMPGQSGQPTAYTALGELSAATIATKCRAIFSQDIDMVDPVSGPVSLVKVRYPSRDINGRRVSLSGLLAMPTEGAPKGLVLYYHGTTTMPENVPSRYKGAVECAEAELAVLTFATAGYAVVAPDYLGLGDSPGRHPYPYGSVNCRSGIDMIDMAKAFAKGRKVGLGKGLFVTGYSEGGAVAMWAAKKIGENRSLTLTGAVPMAGPYDMSGAQSASIISNQSNAVWLGARFYLIAYAGYSADTNVPGVRLENLFSPSFASYIPHVFGKGATDETVIKKIVQKGLQLGAFQSVRKILDPDLTRALRAVDTSNPFVRRLTQENVFDWTPRCPLYMVCLKSDYVVDPENTFNAVRAMRARGVTSDRMGYTVIENSKLTHMNGIVASMVLARRFMDSGFSAVQLNEDPVAKKK